MCVARVDEISSQFLPVPGIILERAARRSGFMASMPGVDPPHNYPRLDASWPRTGGKVLDLGEAKTMGNCCVVRRTPAGRNCRLDAG